MREVTFLDGRVRLIEGDCREIIARLPDASVDSVVTDPPYALTGLASASQSFGGQLRSGGRTVEQKAARRGFMGKDWDNGSVAFDPAFWTEVLRVLKPGGHMVAFSGTRTYHRMVCAIEDAGFEIRDQIGWVFGAGFPKSHDVSKGIDRAAGAAPIDTGEIKRASIQRNGQGETWDAGAFASHPEETKQVRITRPATEEAARWQGWGTALKPAWEPICLARKPLIGTVAENVLAHGTGAININGCRVDTGEPVPFFETNGGRKVTFDGRPQDVRRAGTSTKGRWPANLVHDGSEEVLAAFPETHAAGTCSGREFTGWQSHGELTSKPIPNDSGSAARFFYTAKADSDDRIGSKHPTVKPVDLMRWLVRLVTPPGGTVLDPFAGTGTTAEAAYYEGFSAILIEREAEYIADIERRMRLVMAGPDERARESIKARGANMDPGPLFAHYDAADDSRKSYELALEECRARGIADPWAGKA